MCKNDVRKKKKKNTEKKSNKKTLAFARVLTEHRKIINVYI